jgi:hypothetical protein
MESGLVSPTDEGTPQGGPLSPLLSNLVLDELDRELEQRGHRFVRYADDCNIYVRSERAGQRVMDSVSSFITNQLKLKVNGEKSAVARRWQRKFLGFSFTNGQQPKRRIAPTALRRFKQRVRELTRRTRGVSIQCMVRELAVYLNGWRSYFSFCQTPSVLAELDGWMRRRLRCMLWKQWKRGRTRYARLQSHRRRAVSGANGWQLSRPVAPSCIPGSQYRTARRLLRLAWTPQTYAAGTCLTDRTAVYGPVRTVVWEARSGDAPPYPDFPALSTILNANTPYRTLRAMSVRKRDMHQQCCPNRNEYQPWGG